jgi:hypothetical protein
MTAYSATMLGICIYFTLSFVSSLKELHFDFLSILLAAISGIGSLVLFRCVFYIRNLQK